MARAWAAYLARGIEGATAYARGSLADGDIVPGLSDIDVAIVVPSDPADPGRAARRALARWLRPHRAWPLADRLLDYPVVLERDELASADSSALTCQDSIYFGPWVSQDLIRLLERPGLYSATGSWCLLSGPDLRPAPRARDSQLRRIAAWLELLAWWQWVFPVCTGPPGPRTASLCVKLIAEPARIWLWLRHGERLGRREEVLDRAPVYLPEERAAFARAIELQRSLADSPDPPLADALGFLIRLSARIAELVATEIAGEGTTEVRLAGAPEPDLILSHGRWHPVPGLAGGKQLHPLPLCDWRSLVSPGLPDDSFALVAGDPADPRVLGVAAASQPYGPYAALRLGPLLVFPGSRARSRLRAVKAEFSDPVSFALAAGQDVARFPNADGFSAQDTARRAVAEHHAWLALGPAGESQGETAGQELAMLLSAARAALFADTFSEAAGPALPVTLAETASWLARGSAAAESLAAEALGEYRRFADHRTPPSPGLLAALRACVQALPAYSAPAGAAQIRSAAIQPLVS